MQVSTTWALTCPETVHQRPCVTREIETFMLSVTITSCCSTNRERPHRSCHLPNEVDNYGSHADYFPCFTAGQEMSPKIAPFLRLGEIWAPPKKRFPGPTRDFVANGTSIGAAVFARLTMTDTPLFHAHVPLLATEVLLSQDRVCGTVYRLL